MATPTTLPATFTAGQVLTAAEMNNLRGAFRILQVVSTTKTDVFSSSQASGAIVDVTGLSASITPSATSSKILVFVSLNGINDVTGQRATMSVQLKRAGTAIGGGTVAGNRTSINGAQSVNFADAANGANVNFHYLDSPATTSATTYQVAVHNSYSVTSTLIVNQFGSDTNNSYVPRTSSTITVMEISA